MNSWSIRRKRIIFAIILLVTLIFIGIPVFFIFYKVPTCFDGIKNGDELEVDCGGSCQKLCIAESLPIIIKGDTRIINVATSTYVALAYLENPNANAGIYRAFYDINIFTADNPSPIKKIEGSTFVPAGEEFAIYEGPFIIEENTKPVRASLSWKEPLSWEKNISKKPAIEIRSRTLSREETSPRLQVLVENTSLETISNIDLIVLVFDEYGNIFNASKTFIDQILGNSNASAIFSWLMPFEKIPARYEILIRSFPDRSFIRQ